jgi:hypothetical protein
VLKLGAKLIIDGQTYSDLDEIVGRYVQPMAQLVDDLKRNEKYFEPQGDDALLDVEAVVKRNLLAMKKAAPSRIPYLIFHKYELPAVAVHTR